jgi:hypothetical protein
MPLSNLSRAASNIRAYMGRVYISDYTGATPTLTDMGPVRAPRIEIEPVVREADSEGREPVLSYDFTISFVLLELNSTRRTILQNAQRGCAVFFTKTPTVTPPSWDSANNRFNGSANGFLIERVWLQLTANVNFSGEGDAYECRIQFRATPTDAAALFDGTNNALRLV